jgi:hypothetical protein
LEDCRAVFQAGQIGDVELAKPGRVILGAKSPSCQAGVDLAPNRGATLLCPPLPEECLTVENEENAGKGNIFSREGRRISDFGESQSAITADPDFKSQIAGDHHVSLLAPSQDLGPALRHSGPNSIEKQEPGVSTFQVIPGL